MERINEKMPAITHQTVGIHPAVGAISTYQVSFGIPHSTVRQFWGHLFGSFYGGAAFIHFGLLLLE